jgi:hypothetical protein
VKVGTQIEAVFGMIFEGDSGVLLVVSGSYRTVRTCNVPDLASLGNVANVCVGSMVYNI